MQTKEESIRKQEEIPPEENRKNKVSLLYSIKLKILLLVAGVLLVATIGVLWAIIPAAKNNVTELTKNYMKDLALISGRNIEREIELEGAARILTAEELDSALHDVKVEGMESSYAYVVATDGTMLYHPTPEKIGKPVENAAVKQLLGEISQGNRPLTDVITYAFKGVNKYAAFYIGQGMDYILIVTADEKEAFQSINSLLQNSVSVSLLILVVCIVVGIIIAFRMTQPIDKITASVVKLSQLDFSDTQEMTKLTQKRDETGSMAKAAVVLQEKLTEVVRRLQEQSRELYVASDAMNQSAEEICRSVEQAERAVNEIAEGATSQAQETQTATENIVLMGNMIEDTNNEVEELRTNARAMRTAGEKATNILTELTAINQQTKDAIQIVYEQTEKTGKFVAEIKKATDIITDIAEETNLLSLNASIEAARAGEAGRGFAVVASQIQQLAEQSNNSASLIQATISSLTAEFEETMKTMENIKEVIAKQDEDVAHTGNAFRDVSEGISKSIDSIRLIATKTAQLDESRIKVVDVVQNLNAIAEENAASTEETSATVTEVGSTMTTVEENARQLHVIANELDQDVKQFHFDEE